MSEQEKKLITESVMEALDDIELDSIDGGSLTPGQKAAIIVPIVTAAVAATGYYTIPIIKREIQIAQMIPKDADPEEAKSAKKGFRALYKVSPKIFAATYKISQFAKAADGDTEDSK